MIRFNIVWSMQNTFFKDKDLASERALLSVKNNLGISYWVISSHQGRLNRLLHNFSLGADRDLCQQHWQDNDECFGMKATYMDVASTRFGICCHNQFLLMFLFRFYYMYQTLKISIFCHVLLTSA